MTASVFAQDEIDRRWMNVALTLARRGLGRTAPNPAVGCVVVAPDGQGGRVLGRGRTQPGGRPHAEPVALTAAGEGARGATLYVTLEPCSHFGKTPPCVDAILAAGVARVVAAVGDPDPRVNGRGFARLRDAGVAVTTGVLQAEAARLGIGHATRVLRGRPHVTLKMAVSRDGKVAYAGGRTAFITGKASRARVHLMRAESDAILVGVGTVLADDPALTCRLPGMADRSPIRVVLDGALRTPLDGNLVRTARATPVWLIAATDAPADRERALRQFGVEVLRVDRGPSGRLMADEAFSLLATRGITRLMVEGGAKVAAGLLRHDLIDAGAISTGPCVLGPDAIDALEGMPLTTLTEAPRFAQTDAFQVGDDHWALYERR